MTCKNLTRTVTVALALVVAFSGRGFAQTPQQNSDARKLFIEGRDLQDDGKLAEAEKKFREALAKYPKADQSDRTAYYLISTLTKLGRVTEARTEIENFRRNYPQSTWMSDVEEKRLTLTQPRVIVGGVVRAAPGTSAGITTVPPPAPVQLDIQHLSADHPFVLLNGGTPTPFGTSLNPFYLNTSLEAELLRVIIEKDADRGIEVARDRLKNDPSDPAVIANLGTISSSTSTQALPFLMALMSNASASPNARSQALFWVSRKSGDKDQMTRALTEMLSGSQAKEMQAAVADALQRFNTTERRAALDQIAQSQNAQRLSMLERIYRSSSNSSVRADLIRAVAQIDDSKAVELLADAAQNDKDLGVRRAAVQALSERKDTDVRTLENILKSLSPSPAK